MPKGVFAIMLAAVCGFLAAIDSVVAEEPVEQKSAAFDRLNLALTHAQQTGRPILAIVGGESCPFCRLLEKEMEQEAVQTELARWTRAAIDVELAPVDATKLAVSGIPALRILTPAGKPVASRNGALKADDLVEWLQEHYDAAASVPSAELTGEGELTQLMIVRLVRELGRADPTLREAAIRRLLASPQKSAPAVVSAFTEGSLSTRLSALELLTHWKAPVEGLDPWRPETITAERLDAITAWAAAAENLSAGASPGVITDEDKAVAAEMIRQMLAADPAEALAIRERLARYGRALLPQVYESLKTAESDEARQRLTELRYRLVATNELALEWPGGLARLAANDAAARRQAVDELVGRATPDDEPLLLELFSDPEPLVRELSLRALQKAGGKNANSALVRLLDDPEPNVRAAVLKQLAESPSPAVVPKLADYVKKEQDADLLVHAVRVLRATKGKLAVDCLMTLLTHESWRVRAEAADAIGESVDGSNVAAKDKADAYVALVELLKDEDTFVVSRAVQVLGKANLATAINPLAEVAGRHPELAVEVVKALAASRSLKLKVAEHLQTFSKHDEPQVRAEAVRGLCEIADFPLDIELFAALEDSDRGVRIAAAEGLFHVMTAEFNQQDAEDLPDASAAEKSADEEAAPETKDTPATQVEEAEPSSSASAEIVLPKWMQKLEPALQKLLAGESPEERLAAALPLVALGKQAEALPVLEAAVAADKHHAPRAAQALRWLPWQHRMALFAVLVDAARSSEDRATVATEMAQRQHPEAAAQIWSLLARPDADAALTQSLIDSLRELQLGSRWYDLSSVPKKRIDAAVAVCRERATSGSRWQRLGALSLLVTLDAAVAVEVAAQLSEQGDLEEALRSDAFQAALYADEKSAAEKRAVAAMAGSNTAIRQISLRYLALGPSAVQTLSASQLELPHISESNFASSSGKPPLLEAPKDLTAEMITPFLESDDPAVRRHASYLLCLLGEPHGLPPLLAAWKESGRRDEENMRLLYRAVAALDDSTQVPVLAEMYQTLASGESPEYTELGQFYWTIRNMSGPEILALRKRIRDEVGVENLGASKSFFGISF